MACIITSVERIGEGINVTATDLSDRLNVLVRRVGEGLSVNISDVSKRMSTDFRVLNVPLSISFGVACDVAFDTEGAFFTADGDSFYTADGLMFDTY